MSVAIRVAPEFGATVNDAEPLPVPELVCSVTQEKELLDDHPHPADAVTLIVPLPPDAAMVKAAGLMENRKRQVAALASWLW